MAPPLADGAVRPCAQREATRGRGRGRAARPAAVCERELPAGAAGVSRPRQADTRRHEARRIGGAPQWPVGPRSLSAPWEAPLMTSRMRLIAAAVICGVVVAVAVALAVPTRSKSATTSPSGPARIVVRPPRGPRFAPGLVVLKPKMSTVRIERRLADPLGGPPFALRVFKAERLAPIGREPSLSHMRLLGHELCAQLGRIYRGKFGWIDAQNVFRPARFDYRDTPTACGDRWHDERSHPEILTTTLVSDPTQPRAVGRETIGWGFGGRLVRSVTLANTKTPHPQVSPRGAFLVVAPTYLRAADLHAGFPYEGGPPIGPQRSANPPGQPPSDNRLGVPRIVGGTGAIEARAPDPGGGIGWGGLRLPRRSRGG